MKTQLPPESAASQPEPEAFDEIDDADFSGETESTNGTPVSGRAGNGHAPNGSNGNLPKKNGAHSAVVTAPPALPKRRVRGQSASVAVPEAPNTPATEEAAAIE